MRKILIMLFIVLDIFYVFAQKKKSTYFDKATTITATAGQIRSFPCWMTMSVFNSLHYPYSSNPYTIIHPYESMKQSERKLTQK